MHSIVYSILYDSTLGIERQPIVALPYCIGRQRNTTKGTAIDERDSTPIAFLE